MISIEDFKKLDIRVGKVLEAEPVEGSEKLVKLRIDIGSEVRQVLAGIAKFYPPETFIGKSVVILINLEPRSLMGFESQGMLLAADTAGGPWVLVPDREAPPGAIIK